VLVLDAAGFDDIIVETVGVGQSEVEVAATADTTVVAIAPGMGDGIQAAKAGILEVADVFVINKADHGGAGKLESELRGMLEMGHALEDADAPASWWPPIVRTVAVRGEGLPELVETFGTHAAHLETSGEGERHARERALHTIREIALEQIRLRFARLDDGDDPLLDALASKVVVREIDPYVASDELLDALEGGEDA
jgi:LAO/AO transport system kinase